MFSGIICYFSAYSDLCHTDTHIYAHVRRHSAQLKGGLEAIESPGQQVDKGDAAGGMPCEGKEGVWMEVG